MRIIELGTIGCYYTNSEHYVIERNGKKLTTTYPRPGDVLVEIQYGWLPEDADVFGSGAWTRHHQRFGNKSVHEMEDHYYSEVGGKRGWKWIRNKK